MSIFKKSETDPQLIQDAVSFCVEKGLILGTDFTLENAISKANAIQFEKLIQEKISEEDEFYFNGDEYCNDGDGDCTWDGVSRRCDCGNRRVSWDYDGDFRNMRIYGEAH